MRSRATYDVKPPGGFSFSQVPEPELELLAAAAHTAWTAIDAVGAQLVGTWTPDEEFETELANAGWQVKPPIRRRILPLITIESGEMTATLEVHEPAALRQMLLLTAEALFPARELVVGPVSKVGEVPSLTLTLANEKVIDVCGEVAGAEAALAAVDEVLQRTAPTVGLHVRRRS